MGLAIVRPKGEVVGIAADRRLYLTTDGQVVDEGHAGAALLLATPGWVIPADQVEALGLHVKDGKVTQAPREIPPMADAESAQAAEEEPEPKKARKRKVE